MLKGIYKLEMVVCIHTKVLLSKETMEIEEAENFFYQIEY